MHAYTEEYLDYAQDILGAAFDYLVNYAHLGIDTVSDYIMQSNAAALFSEGNPHHILGISGEELGDMIIRESNPEWNPVPYSYEEFRSEEYWAGWILALYQWHCCRPLKNILSHIPLNDILSMYRPYHEMSPDSSVIELERRYRDSFSRKDTNLRRIRTSRKISQSELSELSGVKLRSIQMWEQKVNNIDKAQANSLYRLAHVLNCKMEDLLEDPIYLGEMNLDTEF